MKQARKSWQNTTYFVLSAIGAAVGLGNIWKFPYAIGANGGGYFLLAYIICVFFCVDILFFDGAFGCFFKLWSMNNLHSTMYLSFYCIMK